MRRSLFSALFPLAVAMFAVGTDGFVVAGLLPQIAVDLQVDVSVSGQLITVFALVFAVSAPLLGALTSGIDRRTALLVVLGIFVIGNAATAVAPTYETVMGARAITAVGAGGIGAAAFSAAAAIAPEARRGRALALVMGGLTLAIAFGLPAGTLIGGADWRLTMWVVAALGVVAAIGIAVALPTTTLGADTLRERLVPLQDPGVLGVLAVTVLALGGTHVLYTYIGFAVQASTRGSTTALTVILLAFGLGSMIGNTMAGRLADRYPPQRVVTGGLVAAMVVLGLSPLLVDDLASAVGWAVLWGVCVSLPVVPQQKRLVTCAPTASAVLLGLNSSAIYLGIALGGALGGLLHHHLGPSRLGLAAAVVSAVALLLHLATSRRAASVPITRARRRSS